MKSCLFLLVSLFPTAFAGCYQNAETGQFCSGHGWCDRMVCDCWDGYEGAACEHRLCPKGAAWNDLATGIDIAHKPAECSNRGHCDYTTGQCMCLLGFEGNSCNRLSCPGFPKCSGHGRCLSQKRLTNDIYGMEYTHWDAEMIYGCLCDDKWGGYDCSEQLCPTGDDPLTKGQNNEIQLLSCDHEEVDNKKTHFYLGFRGKWSPPIYWNDQVEDVKRKIEMMTNIELVIVEFLNPNNDFVCGGSQGGPNNNIGNTYSKQPQITTIQFIRQFGDLPPLRVQTHNPGPTVDVACSTDNVWFKCAQDQFTYVEASGNSAVQTATKGNKEEISCAGRGTCVEGTCVCENNFFSSNGDGPRLPFNPADPDAHAVQIGSRGDCGYLGGTMYQCPGEGSCNGHGNCSAPEFKCQCQNGWTGFACSLRECPFGKAWFGPPEDVNNAHALMECSNRGLCERETGNCFCQEMLEGDACDKMKCPGTMEQEEVGLCFGHGDCLTMEELARKTTINGDATNFTYGERPNDEGRWDHDQIQGCFCDAGYEGVDCAKRTCKRTDDKNTPGFNEVQKFTCYSSNFTADVNSNSIRGGGCFSVVYNAQFDITNNTFLSENHKSDQNEDDLQASLEACRLNVECVGVSEFIPDQALPNQDGTWNYKYNLQRYNDNAGTYSIPSVITKNGARLYKKEKCKFQLRFRQATTLLFDTSATRAEVETAFNNLPTVITGGAKIIAANPVGDGTLCPAGQDNQFEITFSKNFGDLPMVQFITQPHGWWDSQSEYNTAKTGNLSLRPAYDEGVEGTEKVKGTKEDALCGNHGTCDYTNGECSCYEGYSSSDGDGGRGPINDCGFRVPILNVAAATDEG